jgi:hypothetical protein
MCEKLSSHNDPRVRAALTFALIELDEELPPNLFNDSDESVKALAFSDFMHLQPHVAFDKLYNAFSSNNIRDVALAIISFNEANDEKRDSLIKIDPGKMIDVTVGVIELSHQDVIDKEITREFMKKVADWLHKNNKKQKHNNLMKKCSEVSLKYSKAEEYEETDINEQEDEFLPPRLDDHIADIDFQNVDDLPF